MSDDKRIWNLLMEAIGNPYGVAGLMGNLMAESSMNPLCKTGGKGDIRKLSGLEYEHKVMCEEIDKESFCHDGVAFGLAQWAYHSRKKDLYDYCMIYGLDIGSVEAQVQFMLKELPKYKTVWKTLIGATSIAEASDIVLLRYEKPADTSDKVKAKRQLYGQQFYEKFGVNNHFSHTQLIQIMEDIRAKYSLDLANKELYGIDQIIDILKEA